MRRATAPVEILLGFFVGAIVGFFIEQPLIWFLHHLGLTARIAFSTAQTAPLGVEAMWSRVVWDGVFGLAFAAFCTRVPLGVRWAVTGITMVVAVRTLADWFVVPMFWGRAWAGLSADALVIPLLLNVVTAVATAVLLAAATLAAGTFGNKSLT